jgi:hypothetical protein
LSVQLLVARDPTKVSPSLDTAIPGAPSVNFAVRLSLDARGYRDAITTLGYDRRMPVSVNLQTVHPCKLAAMRREVARGKVGWVWSGSIG